ncbi:hypothetical protein A6048_14295 [Dietzia psychralcaliphila]|uniref:Uncharacterized protein n=1 Tax=Dietzia psychralcaliphila TaxID=139021 RepID=A0AAD0NP41_9ACTN|nr:hypothetical protein A6048_14295 [Dietzia psychralcaliphila]
MGASADFAGTSAAGVAGRSAVFCGCTGGEVAGLVVVSVPASSAADSSASRARRRAARLLSSVSSVIRGISPVSSETLTPLPLSSARR